MLGELKQKLERGIEVENRNLRLSKISEGRFKEEENFALHLDEKPLFLCKIFYGRKPYYKEWAELFNFMDKSYFGSCAEEKLISLFYKFLDPGAKIFLEYENDHETFEELEKGIPEVLSRMGFLLFKNNFIHIKNFYFPEGFMEGGRKLKGEKPLNEKNYLKEREKISEEVSFFFFKNKNFKPETEIYRRAREILTISNML